MIRKAMILAAGFGKRIRPLTLETPKPLPKIGKENLLSNTLNFLENYKIDEVIINVHHLGEKISNYINENISLMSELDSTVNIRVNLVLVTVFLPIILLQGVQYILNPIELANQTYLI